MLGCRDCVPAMFLITIAGSLRMARGVIENKQSTDVESTHLLERIQLGAPHGGHGLAVAAQVEIESKV